MAAKRAKVVLPALHTLVAVTWDDAAFDIDKAEEVLPLVTVGWLIRADRVAVIVAGEANLPLTFFRSYTTVPRGMVRSIVALEHTGAPTGAPPSNVTP